MCVCVKCEVLVRLGANIDARDTFNATAIHYSADRCLV